MTPNKIHLLLVDDETEFLQAARAALGRRGFEVTTAESGEEALALLERARPEVAVLDVKMPGMDGVELFGQLRRRLPGVPVVLLTGHGTIQQAFETSRAGVVRYLSKPCEMEALAGTLRQVLEEARQQRGGDEGEAAPEPRIEPGELRALLVDDEEDLLLALSTSLARRGVEVYTAVDGDQALDLLGQHAVSVVLLDLKMPGRDGLELLPRIRALRPDAEVVMLTGHPTAELGAAALQWGVFDVLAKPQGVEALLGRLQAAHQAHLRRVEARRRAEVERILSDNPQ